MMKPSLYAMNIIFLCTSLIYATPEDFAKNESVSPAHMAAMMVAVQKKEASLIQKELDKLAPNSGLRVLSSKIHQSQQTSGMFGSYQEVTESVFAIIRDKQLRLHLAIYASDEVNSNVVGGWGITHMDEVIREQLKSTKDSQAKIANIAAGQRAGLIAAYLKHKQNGVCAKATLFTCNALQDTLWGGIGIGEGFVIDTSKKGELHLASKDVRGANQCFPKSNYHWIDMTGNGKQSLEFAIKKLKGKSWHDVANMP